jgi:predicted Holliday junction resolvase-like endonuclease
MLIIIRIDNTKLLCCICLIGSLKRNTQHNVEKIMSKWLTESRDRVGKKLSEASSKRVEQTKISTGKERRKRQDDESDDE